VKPIVYWLDRTIPLKYRGAVSAGILEWNKAFERIGYKNAIEVRVQPDDADFDTLDFGVASVRWMTNVSPTFGAIGPSHVDPRSGEILDADIAIESLSSRSLRNLRAQVLAQGTDWKKVLQMPADLAQIRLDPHLCENADHSADQMAMRSTCSKPAAISTRRRRGGEVRPRLPHLDDDARGRSHARAAPQLPRLAPATATRALRSRVSAQRVALSCFARCMEYTPVNLARPERQDGAAVSADSSAPTTNGPSSTRTGRCPPPTERAALTRIAARSGERGSRTAPTRTTSSASTPMRFISTWAAMSARSRASASPSPAISSSARRRARSRRVRTTAPCGAR
jgi:hypothetical protein